MEEKLKIEIDELPLSKGVIKTLKEKGIYNFGELMKKYKSAIVKPLTNAERAHYEVTRLGLAMDVLSLDNPDVYVRDMPRYAHANSIGRDVRKEMSRSGVSYKCIETLVNRIKRRNTELNKLRIMKYAGRGGFSPGPKYE